MIENAKVNDLTGQIFGCKEVLYRVKAPRGTNAWWRVKCIHCGREKDVIGTKLKYPKHQSCTCKIKEIQGTTYREELTHAVFTDNKGIEFLVSLEDIDKVKDNTWYVRTTTNGKQYVECAYLGMFETLEEAKAERLKAEEKYFGEYRYKGEEQC